MYEVALSTWWCLILLNEGFLTTLSPLKPYVPSSFGSTENLCLLYSMSPTPLGKTDGGTRRMGVRR